jgi:hypothetical protein
MALFCDGPISDSADLQQYENAILNVASTESIDLGSKLQLAQQDLANELCLFFRRRTSRHDYLWAVQNSQDLKDVVVTGPLRQWHIHTTLALVYRDAYNNQLNNRYQGKWAEYEKLAKQSERTYFQIGVGLVADPVPIGSPPVLSAVPGTGAGGTFYVAATWLNASGDEGAPSAIVQLTTSDGQQLVATVGAAPQNVTSWNAYVGVSPSSVSLQNQSPLGTSSNWTMASGLNAGVPLPSGQLPTWFMVDHRVVERG